MPENDLLRDILENGVLVNRCVGILKLNIIVRYQKQLNTVLYYFHQLQLYILLGKIEEIDFSDLGFSFNL